MATIEDFILRIKVQGQPTVDNAAKSVDNLGKSAAGFGASGNQLSSAVGGIVRSLGGVVGIAALGATAVAGMAMKAISLADALQDISDATGISAGSLNNFKNSLIEAGGKSDDFSAFATKLTQNLGEAAVGNEAAQRSFQKLGVFVRDANGNIRDSGTVLQEVIGKLAAIENPATRSAMAVELLGKQAKMIDWTKVNAINDPFKDAQIAQLAKYQEALDKIANNAANNLLTVFGKLAIAIDEAQQKADKAQKAANERGNTIKLAPFSGQPMEVPMTKSEKDRYELEKKVTEAYKDNQRELKRLQSIGQQGGGDYGGPDPKAVESSEKRIAQLRIEINKNAQLEIAAKASAESLKGANDRMSIDLKAEADIKNAKINSAADIEKAKIDVYNQTGLDVAAKEAEFAIKRTEIAGKTELEISKIRIKAAEDVAKTERQLQAKIFAELQSQIDETNKQLAEEENRINGIIKSSIELTNQQKIINEEMAYKNQVLSLSGTLTDRERKYTQDILNIEIERSRLLREIENIKDLPYDEQLKRNQEINNEIDARIALVNEELIITEKHQQDFSTGWTKAYRQYIEDSQNAADQASTIFNSFTKGFEDAWVKMVETGKFAWKDLVKSLISDIARIQAKKLLANLFGGGGSGGDTGFGTGNSYGNLDLGGFLAAGGPAMANNAYIVGEKGPELFIPKTAGTVIANNALGSSIGSTNVTYNINAVDAMSFKSMIARDPAFIHAVATQGAGTVPRRR